MVIDSFQFLLLPSEPVLWIPCFTVSLSVQVSVCQCILLTAACISPCWIILEPVWLHGWNSWLSFSIRWSFPLPGVIDGFYLNLAILDLMYAIILLIIPNQFPLLPLTLTWQGRSIFHLVVARWRWKPGFPWLSAYTQQGRGSSWLLFFMLIFPQASVGTTPNEKKKGNPTAPLCRETSLPLGNKKNLSSSQDKCPVLHKASRSSGMPRYHPVRKDTLTPSWSRSHPARRLRCSIVAWLGRRSRIPRLACAQGHGGGAAC